MRGDRLRFDREQQIRLNSEIYQNRTKFEITLFSLLSYSRVCWKSHNFRIYCENLDDYNIIEDFIHRNFHDPKIAWERSDTEKKFYDSLCSYEFADDELLYLAVNNDHPLMCDPQKFSRFISSIKHLFKSCPDLYVPISHYYENVNSVSVQHPLWLHYGGVKSEVIEKNQEYYLVKYNKVYFESFHIARVKRYKEVFIEQGTQRCIRPEDTTAYLSNVQTNAVIPRFEILRHYDGYFQYFDKVAPVGIPEELVKNNFQLSDLSLGSYFKYNASNKPTYRYKGAEGIDVFKDDIPFFLRPYIDSAYDINYLPVNPANRETQSVFYLLTSGLRMLKSLIKNLVRKVK